MKSPKDGRAFPRLCAKAEAAGYVVTLPSFYDPDTRQQTLVVHVNADQGYSRNVQPSETVDRCAEIVEEALTRGRVL